MIEKTTEEMEAFQAWAEVRDASESVLAEAISDDDLSVALNIIRFEDYILGLHTVHTGEGKGMVTLLQCLLDEPDKVTSMYLYGRDSLLALRSAIDLALARWQKS